jgi:hypothetical protein
MMSNVNRWLDKDTAGVDINTISDLVYQKSEADGLLLGKADTSDVYSKTSSYSQSEINKLHGLFRYPPIKVNNNTLETKIGSFYFKDNHDQLDVYKLFDQNQGSYWTSIDSLYDPDTGVYQGDNRFVIEGGGDSAYGEWIQSRSMANAFTLNKMTISTPKSGGQGGQLGLAFSTARDFSLYGQTGTEPFQLIGRITDVDAVSTEQLEYIVPHVFDFDSNTENIIPTVL